MLASTDRLVVMDLEATCDDQGRVPKLEMEIIEIGAVLVDGADLRPTHEFQAFIRPVRHPILTEFCRSLTSIRQVDVDQASTFRDVIQRFEKWIHDNGGNVFGSWGDYDRRQMDLDCHFHEVPNPMPGRHLNLKELFSKTRGLSKKLGMAEALRSAGLDLQGTHHRGIDDARNIAQLVALAVGAAKPQGRR